MKRNAIAEERSDWIRRMQNCHDQMKVCVYHAVTDITGTAGMMIIRSILTGERDPQVLAHLRDARCRKSEIEIATEVTGNWRSEYLFNLRQALQMYDQLSPETPEMSLCVMLYSTFPDERHFVSYLRLAPNLSISTGKKVPHKSKATTCTRVAQALRMAALR